MVVCFSPQEPRCWLPCRCRCEETGLGSKEKHALVTPTRRTMQETAKTLTVAWPMSNREERVLCEVREVLGRRASVPKHATIELLATGVWLCRMVTGKMMVLKVGIPDRMEEFVREVRAAETLRDHPHDHIMPVDMYYAPQPTIVSPAGLGDLFDVLYARNQLGYRGFGTATLCIWKQIESAVIHLHGLSMCHRDVKPENIVVWGPVPTDSEGRNRDVERLARNPDHIRVVLIDLGMSCRNVDRATETCGSPAYVAPEVVTSGAFAHVDEVPMWAEDAPDAKVSKLRLSSGRYVWATRVPTIVTTIDLIDVDNTFELCMLDSGEVEGSHPLRIPRFVRDDRGCTYRNWVNSPPEGDAAYDPYAADAFSLGAVLFTLSMGIVGNWTLPLACSASNGNRLYAGRLLLQTMHTTKSVACTLASAYHVDPPSAEVAAYIDMLLHFDPIARRGAWDYLRCAS